MAGILRFFASKEKKIENEQVAVNDLIAGALEVEEARVAARATKARVPRSPTPWATWTTAKKNQVTDKKYISGQSYSSLKVCHPACLASLPFAAARTWGCPPPRDLPRKDGRPAGVVLTRAGQPIIMTSEEEQCVLSALQFLMS